MRVLRRRGAGARRFFFFLLVLAAVRPAGAAVADYLGKAIVEVHVRSGDTELRDASLLEIIETRTGSPLTMLAVRDTLAHLYGLGRYQDVQVDAQLRSDGVVPARKPP